MDQVNILKMVRSVEDQEEVKNTISSLLENLYKTGVNKTTQSKSEYEKKITEEILSDLNRKNIKEASDIENYLNSLLESLKNLPTVKITIAVSPNNHLLDMLKSWAEENLGKNTVFDIDTDSDILGGVILSTKKGLYKDFSLSKKLNDVFAEKRKEIFFQT